MILKPGRAVSPSHPPPKSCGVDGEGTLPRFREALEAQTPLGIEHQIPAKLRQVLLHPQRKMQRRSNPHPGLEFIRGCRVRAPSEDGKKYGVGTDLWENSKGGLLFPGSVRGLRCSSVGAAPPEPLRSLSAPDAIARQQLPVRLQFYP